MKGLPRPARPLRWIGSSLKDYRNFRCRFRIVELLGDHDGDTYRAVYTVRLKTAVYVLHAFKKKSKRGIATAQTDVKLIKRRLCDAEIDNDLHLRKDEKR